MKHNAEGRTYHYGRPCHFLLLHIKLTLVAIGPELDAREPRWRPAHLLTDRVEGYAGAAFYDQLIMHVADDLTVAQGPHGVGQNVPADGLHDILHELWTVALDPGPVLRGVDPHIGDGLAAETVLAESGFDIGQSAAARQRDEQHAVYHHERDVADPGLRPQ